MVGVPSSKGCALCLKRSVKCDEARPSCSQCRRGGRNCPGYAQGVRLKFVDEGPKLRRGLTKATTERTAVANTTAPSTTEKPGSPDGGYHNDVAKHHYRYWEDPGRVHAPIEMKSPSLERQQLALSFVSAMFPLGAESVQRSFLGSWLWHIPARLGCLGVNNMALDYATLSVALAYFARMSSAAPDLLHHAQLAYMSALRYLATAVGSCSTWASTDVLGATMLLGHYESFVNVDTAWIHHAGGAARLLQMRGARRCYESVFDYTIFLACRGSIIAESLTSGTPCFLEDEQWQSIPDGLMEFPLLPESPELYHTVFGLFAKIPGLVSNARLVTNHTPDGERLSALARAEKVRQDLNQWYHQYTSSGDGLKPVLINCETDDPSRPVYVYKDVPSASVITTYCAYLITLNSAIDTLSSSDLLAGESYELTKAICWSADYCSRAGYCGTQVMRFSLPIARAAMPVEHHDWIDDWISKFQSAHDASRIQLQKPK